MAPNFPNQSVTGFDFREVYHENLHGLKIRQQASRASIADAIAKYGFDEHFANRLCEMTETELDRLANIGFSLLTLDEEKFQDVKKLISDAKGNFNPQVSIDVKDSIFVCENRAGFVRRWHTIKLSKVESMRRFGISQYMADQFSAATYDYIDRIASTGLPLFKLCNDPTIIDLARFTSSSNELCLLSVLRGN